MKKISFYLLLFLSISIFYGSKSFGQVNFLGKPGLVRVPKASVNELRDYISFQVSHMPLGYGINNFMSRSSEEVFYSVQVQPLSWVSVNFVLTRPVDVPRIGVGDRHLDLQFFVLSQEKNGVDVSFIFSPMMGSSFIDHNSVIVGRKFSLSNNLSLESTAGYGLKSLYKKPPEKFGYENDNFQWIRKSEFGNYYLSGFFGGLQLQIRDVIYLSAEYDSRYFNIGSSVVLWKKLGLQVNLLDLNKFTGMLSYKVFLDKEKKFTIRNNEQN